jgi:hypothetical protein
MENENEMPCTPEYRQFRCCMCPNIRTPFLRKCPGKPGILHPNDTPCRFVKVYQDDRGWQYFVRAGIGLNTFKAFYCKPDQTREHGWRPVQWCNSFDTAQADLNMEAQKRGWEEMYESAFDGR